MNTNECVRIDGEYYFIDKDGYLISDDPVVNYVQENIVPRNIESDWEWVADKNYQMLLDVLRELRSFENYLIDSKRISRKQVRKYLDNLFDAVDI